MNNKKIILFSALLIGTGLLAPSQSFAGRESFNRPSEELRSAIATAATSLGYDLSTEEGRKQFGDYMKSARDAAATAAGADLTTEAGRKAYMETVKAHREEVAKAQNFDLTTQAGREALEKYLISSGDYASVMPAARGGHERPPKNDKNSSASNTSGRAAGNRRQFESGSSGVATSADAETGAPTDSSDQKPPCGNGNGSSASVRGNANSGSWGAGSSTSGSAASNVAASSNNQQRPPQHRR